MKSIVIRTSLALAVLCAISIAGSYISHAQKGKAVYQINCGGPAVDSYAADTYLDGGGKYDNNDSVDDADVPNPPPGKVYKYQRYGDFRYVFPNLIDAALFKPTSSRTAVKIITVYWRTDQSNVAKSEVIRQFKNNFDFQALRQMLDQ
jgi:hypothetical protein